MPNAMSVVVYSTYLTKSRLTSGTTATIARRDMAKYECTWGSFTQYSIDIEASTKDEAQTAYRLGLYNPEEIREWDSFPMGKLSIIEVDQGW
jgi:hypothetical protein|tara:strand:- start:292 stop:567 length:276 start_codon:yes stop_codon:yes gene_type:complete